VIKERFPTFCICLSKEKFQIRGAEPVLLSFWFDYMRLMTYCQRIRVDHGVNSGWGDWELFYWKLHVI